MKKDKESEKEHRKLREQIQETKQIDRKSSSFVRNNWTKKYANKLENK